jgi:hypothetical protein
MNKLKVNLSDVKSKDYNLNLQKSIQTCKDLHLALIEFNEDTSDLVIGLTSYYAFVDRLFTTKGQTHSLLYLKECRQLFLCFLAGNTYTPKVGIRVARHTDLLPKRLGISLCKLARRRDPDILKHILTSLMLTRFLPLQGSPADYSTIVDGHLSPLPKGIGAFIKRFVKSKK